MHLIIICVLKLDKVTASFSSVLPQEHLFYPLPFHASVCYNYVFVFLFTKVKAFGGEILFIFALLPTNIFPLTEKVANKWFLSESWKKKN